MTNDIRELPTLYLTKESCCGCTACASICPKNAIVMEVDEEGFLYPNVNAAFCVRCYLCIDICPFKQN